MIPGPSIQRRLRLSLFPPLSLVKASPAGSFRYANRFLSLSLPFLLQLLRDGLQILLPCYVLMRRIPGCPSCAGGRSISLALTWMRNELHICETPREHAACTESDRDRFPELFTFTALSSAGPRPPGRPIVNDADCVTPFVVPDGRGHDAAPLAARERMRLCHTDSAWAATIPV